VYKIARNWDFLKNCVCDRGAGSCSPLLSHQFALPASPPVARLINHPASKTRVSVSAGGPGRPPTLTRAAASPTALQMFVQLVEGRIEELVQLHGCTEPCGGGQRGTPGASGAGCRTGLELG